MTGADSPVIADSSTERDAFDDVAVAGDQLAGRHDALVADRQLARRLLDGRTVGLAARCATVSERVLRSVSACALPRPSATASAKFANSTVNHSQTATSPTNTLSEALADGSFWKNSTVVQHAADLDDEHHRVARHLCAGRAS